MTDARQRLLAAERHLREAEARVTRQREIIAELEQDHHPRTAATARKVLSTLLHGLDVAKQCVELMKRELARSR